MCNNGKESIEGYAMRRNRIGYYFCTKCKHNHKIDSKKGISHIGNDLLFNVVENKELAESVEPDDYHLRFKANQEKFRNRNF